MKTAIIIPTIGAGNVLETFCMAGLYYHTDDMPEIIIVDNGAKSPVKIGWGTPKIVRSSKPLSFAAACNLGAKNTKADLLIFLNDDVRVLPLAIETLIGTFDAPDVAIAGAKLYSPDGSLQHVGVVFGKHRVPYHDKIGERDNPKLTGIRDAVAVTGALMAVRRTFFDEVGGFCEDFPDGNYEDIDLCLTARSRGYRVVVQLDCRAVHVGGATASGKDRKAFDLEMRRNWQSLNERWKDKGNQFFGITKKTQATERERAWGLCE